jgi:hypothetical protein
VNARSRLSIFALQKEGRAGREASRALLWPERVWTSERSCTRGPQAFPFFRPVLTRNDAWAHRSAPFPPRLSPTKVQAISIVFNALRDDPAGLFFLPSPNFLRRPCSPSHLSPMSDSKETLHRNRRCWEEKFLFCRIHVATPLRARPRGRVAMPQISYDAKRSRVSLTPPPPPPRSSQNSSAPSSADGPRRCGRGGNCGRRGR